MSASGRSVDTKPQAVIFDLFGTLVPTYDAKELDRKITEVLGVSEKSYYEALSFSADQRYKGKFPTVKAMFEYVFKLLDLPESEQTLEQVSRYRPEATRRKLQPRADAVQTLKRLKSAGFRLGVLSDCSPDVPPLYLETPVRELVDSPVFSCVVKLRKPDPKIYAYVCHTLEVSPKQCIYVGDGGSNELTGARAVGMRSVLLCVPAGERVQPEARMWSGDAISTLGELGLLS